MHDNNDDLQQNNLVERLTIRNFALSSSQKNSTAFPNISKCLPALKFLIFINCDNDGQQCKQEVKINLPYTSLKVFTWSSKENYYVFSPNSIFYLKIILVGSSEHFYYKINDDKITSLSEWNYQEATNKKHDEEILAIKIRCVKIAQFRLSLEN